VSTIAERARRTRADQGFPPKIEDETTLDAAAALLADVLAGWARTGLDHGDVDADRVGGGRAAT
jgi:hypothetical protein